MSDNKSKLFKEFLASNPDKAYLGEVNGVTGAKDLNIHPAKFILGSKDNQVISAKTASQQKLMAALFEAHSIIVADGPAGVGKTFLAIIAAIIHKELGIVDKIYLARPAVDEGESVGFVPGGMNQKLMSFMRPMLEALVKLGRKDLVEMIQDVKSADKTDNGENRTVGMQIVDEINRDLELVSLSQLMGRNLDNAFIIIDEGQLTEVGTMVTALTRMAIGSRVVVCGDTMQARGKYVKRNGMHFAVWYANTHLSEAPLEEGNRCLEDLYGNNGWDRLPENDSVVHVKFSDDEVKRHVAVKGVVKGARKYMEKMDKEDRAMRERRNEQSQKRSDDAA